MKKLLLALLVVAAVAAAYYVGRRGLPTDLGGGDGAGHAPAVPSVERARERLEHHLGLPLDGATPGAARSEGAAADPVGLTADDLRDLAVTVLSGHDNGRRLLASSKALEAGIGDETIEVGVVINLSEIPDETLDAEERRVVDNVRRMLPFLADRDLYLGIEGRPLAIDGRLAFAPDATVKLALFEFELESFADRLGLDVGERLEVELPFAVRQAEVRERRLWLRLGG